MIVARKNGSHRRHSFLKTWIDGVAGAEPDAEVFHKVGQSRTAYSRTNAKFTDVQGKGEWIFTATGPNYKDCDSQICDGVLQSCAQNFCQKLPVTTNLFIAVNWLCSDLV